MSTTPTPSEAPDINPERWLADYGDALYGFAMARVQNPTLAEDLIQETFFAAMKAKERFSGRASEKTWLIGILKHKIIDHYRKSGREKIYEDTETLEIFERDFFEASGHLKNSPSNWAAHPDKSVERSEFWVVLQKCLAALKEQHRAAFTLRELDGEDSAEICKILGISESNLWVILHRARLRLRACLERNWFSPPVKETA
jgi:RNA polymerase sigma-70 factor (ECF subfamily)